MNIWEFFPNLSLVEYCTKWICIMRRPGVVSTKLSHVIQQTSQVSKTHGDHLSRRKRIFYLRRISHHDRNHHIYTTNEMKIQNLFLVFHIEQLMKWNWIEFEYWSYQKENWSKCCVKLIYNKIAFEKKSLLGMCIHTLLYTWCNVIQQSISSCRVQIDWFGSNY